jgi:hypothetical protein
MASQMTSKIVITLITGLRPDRHAMIPVYHKMAFGMARCNGSDASWLEWVRIVGRLSTD